MHEKERTVLPMHSPEALPQARTENMKRQCAQSGRIITYMPFSSENVEVFLVNDLLALTLNRYAVVGGRAGRPSVHHLWPYSRGDSCRSGFRQ